MPSERLIVFLTAIGLFALIFVWGLGGGFVLRRRLIYLIQKGHPVIWAQAVSLSDMSDHLGRLVPSSNLLLKLVAEAERRGASDPKLHRTALWLKRANVALIGCVLYLIALALAAKLLPR